MTYSHDELVENPRLRDARQHVARAESSPTAIVRAGALHSAVACAWPGLHRAHAGGTAQGRKRARRRKNSESAETETVAAYITAALTQPPHR